MQVARICYQIVCGCTLLASVFGHSLSNTILEKTEEMNKRQTLICNNHCPFGFVSDVEGDLTCTCYDPCSMILCLQGTVCVAEMPKDCETEPCRPKTRCVEDVNAVQTHLKDDYLQNWPEVPQNFQKDEPDQWWSTGSGGNLCSQALPMTAVICKHKRRRWHFNAMTGKCERFMGCVTSGNNFGRKRFCKEECRYAYIEKRDRLRAMLKPEVAHTDCSLDLSQDAFNCDDQVKRWYFNSRTQKCEKFIGCDTKGNNFSRKTDCKYMCLAKTKQFLHLKEKHLQESSAR